MKPLPGLDTVQTFLALAQELNYRRTAERLNLDQSALTRRIQKLEAEIAALKPDAERMDWIAMHGSFGVDSGTGLAGGNGQKHVAATRSAIDAARAALKDTK